MIRRESNYAFPQTVVLVCDQFIMYKLQIHGAAGSGPLAGRGGADRLHPWSGHFRRAEASGAGGDAAPAFVQLGVVGSDVVSYIPQSKEGFTAERTWPVLALNVPEAMHD